MSAGYLFDVVVPVGPNDVGRIHRQLAHLRYAVGRRHTYVVTARVTQPTDASNSDTVQPALPQFENCTTIDEADFPFGLADVAAAHGARPRNGWYFQQLLKLYAGRVIPGILDRYLVVDADTFLQRPVEFVLGAAERLLRPAYAFGYENHPPYFEHMARLHPMLRRVRPEWSGICHHMVFQRAHIDRLFEVVEGHHAADGKKRPFWELFLALVDPAHFDGAGASEYEIYFNFLQLEFPQETIIRSLRWVNAGAAALDAEPAILAAYDYVSCHYYL